MRGNVKGDGIMSIESIKEKIWDQYRMYYPKYPEQCFMMSAVKSVGGSLYTNDLIADKDQIIKEYNEEKPKRSVFFFEALHELDFKLIFDIVDSFKNESTIDEIIESHQRIDKNIERIKSLLRR